MLELASMKTHKKFTTEDGSILIECLLDEGGENWGAALTLTPSQPYRSLVPSSVSTREEIRQRVCEYLEALIAEVKAAKLE